MKLLRIKSIVFGIIIGVLTTASITVFGLSLASPRVEAWLQTQQITIIVNGRTLELTGDSSILNFNGRVHVPARDIAESLGATVLWDEPSQTILIVSPQPEVIEIEVPVEVHIPPPVPARRYDPLPMRRVLREISINITAMEFYLSQTDVILDLESRNQWPIMFLRNQTFIEFRGERFPLVEDDFNRLFSDSRPGRYERENLRISFAPLPEDIIRSGDDIDEIRLVIGVEIMERVFMDDPFALATFEFNIDPSDEPFFNFRR